MAVTSGLKQLLDRHTQALEQDPDNPKLRVEVAEVLESMNLPEDALVQYETAARLFVNLGLYREAAATCTRVLNLNPRHKEARRILEGMRRRGLVEATETATHALAQTPTDAPEESTPEEPAVITSALAEEPPAEQGAPGPEEVVLAPPPDEGAPALPDSPLVDARGAATEPAVGQPAAEDLPAVAETVPPSMTPVATKELVSRSNGIRPSESELGSIAGLGLLPLLPPEVATSGIQQSFDSGATIIEEGERTEQLFLLIEGRAQATWGQGEATANLGYFEHGAFFGEMALLGDGLSQMTVQAVDPCTVLMIPRSHFRKLLLGSTEANRLVRSVYRDRLKAMALKTSPLFGPLHDRVARRFLGQFRPTKHDEDATVLSQGDAPTGLFLVLLGELKVSVRDTSGGDVEVAKLGHGDFFGEISLIRNRPVSATVTSASFVQLLRLDPESFHQFNDRHPRFKAMLDTEAKRREKSIEQVLA